MERAGFILDEYLDFLDELRETGVTNMWGAAPYIEQEFPEVGERESEEILVYWMKSFGERHPQ